MSISYEVEMKILIVEDNEKNLKLFKIIVESLGHETLTATNGEDGVMIAKEKLPDLILMDIQMPKIDGVAAFKLLQKDERTRRIPVIALTSYAMKGDRERLLEEGFSDYLSKPIDKNNFIAVIKKVFE